MSTASEDFLSQLHQGLAEELLRRIADGNATASDLAVAAKFLKDNNITCAPDNGSALDELAQQIEQSKTNALSTHQKQQALDQFESSMKGVLNG